jgi:C-terminal processing protease CtpA/Prc
MKPLLIYAGTLSLVLFCASSVFANDDPQGKGQRARNPEAVFNKLDTNGDGKLSKEEFAKVVERMREKAKSKGKTLPAKAGDGLFNRLDTNHDGFISLDEFKKMREKAAARAKKGKAGTNNLNKN